MDENEKKVRDLYREITLLLMEKGLTITTMESATSGQIASLITDTEGSSAVFKGAFVSYSNEVKELLGVPHEVIERYGVYSEETASEMAKACRRILKADIGVGVTGTFGNIDPANPLASTPGEVYFAVCTEKECIVKKCCLGRFEERLRYKLETAAYVGNEIMGLLSGK